MLPEPLGTTLLVFKVPQWLKRCSRSGQVLEGADGLSPELAERLRAENPMLQQMMKPRHLVMIAVGKHADLLWRMSPSPHISRAGGSVGTGLFVGSGSALHSGGPAALIIAWLLMGIMLINITQARLFCNFLEL